MAVGRVACSSRGNRIYSSVLLFEKERRKPCQHQRRTSSSAIQVQIAGGLNGSHGAWSQQSTTWLSRRGTSLLAPTRVYEMDSALKRAQRVISSTCAKTSFRLSRYPGGRHR